ncbi:type II toxin-antitoxin system antitoxin SocA domain-containing protein [Bosea sp. ANAM02]|uniref:Panacea domain-containing protein n=1 Tax=Bosea sp. ANAM02 TaxID=2020412 RepID=UPI00140ED8A4|nr:type II toxin-antitoxin system antitoxin SocA domain-containing protein [Bosea sp. ANAM02]BCB20295.1 hypothetical protein OCUBac02_31890 [Bosea sp. ANAM02]
MLDNGTYVSPTAVATWFVNAADRSAGEVITHLKVQKLVYYADAWFLANFDRALINEHMQAWAHGPVSASVYQKYRGKGFEPLPPERAVALPDALLPFLKAIQNEYGQYTAKRLEQMTHEEAPWHMARGNLPPEARCTQPIDKLLMRNFYAARLGKEAIQQLRN